jgi:lipoprotein NlpD
VKPPVKTAREKLPAEAARPAAKEPPADVPAEPAPVKPEQGKIVFDRSRFIWPMRGSLAAKFGIQPNGLKYNGIRISAREGTPIVASAAGEVIHAAPIKYYGETIIIKHDRHYSTVYTFLKNKKVRVGDRVKKGERIALLSHPDNGNGRPYLNFEIRQNNKPRNPLFLLPETGGGSP